MEISQSANIEFIKNHMLDDNKEQTHLLISNYNTNDTLLIEDIVYIESQERYTVFCLKQGKKKISSLSLNFFENLLNISTFNRIHRSVVVNYNEVVDIGTGRAPEITMSNGEQFKVAYRRKSAFIAAFKE